MRAMRSTSTSLKAGAPRHWYLQQSHGHHEFVCQRYLRTHRNRIFTACALQQEIHNQLLRNPDRHQVAVAWRTRKTRSQRGYESGH